MPKKQYQSGFTLVEIAIVIIIISILVGMGASLLQVSMRTHFSSQETVNNQWQNQVAMSFLVDDIRAIRSTSAITSATSTSLSFKDIYDNTITYQLTGTLLMRNSNAIAKNVQSINFTYYTEDGVSTTTAADIRYVVITITYQDTTANYFPSYTFTKGIALWNVI